MALTGFRAPSVKRLVDALKITPEKARTARGLIQGAIRTKDEKLFPKSNRLFDRCHHPMRRLDRIIECLNELLEMHGVEYVSSGEQQMDGSHIVAEYLNSGDTYSMTLLFNHRSEAFSLTTWGDFIERNQRRYSIQ